MEPTDGLMLRMALRRSWRVLPGDLLGLVVLGVLRIERRPRRVAVLDDQRRLVCTAALVEDARLGRFLDAVPLRPRAMTLGRYVLARRPLDEATVRHELEHVRQWAVLGPLFLPAYLATSVEAIIRRGDPYLDNRLERAARARGAAGPSRSTDGELRSPGVG